MRLWELITDVAFLIVILVALWLLYQFRRGWRYGLKNFLLYTGIGGLATGFFTLSYIFINTMLQPGMVSKIAINFFGEAWWELVMMIVCIPGVIWCLHRLWEVTE